MSLRIISFALILLSLAACRQPSDVKPPQTTGTLSDAPFEPNQYDWPHVTSDLLPAPRVTYGRLENGLRYAILPQADEHGIVSIQLNIAAGWNDEPEAAYGVAHLLEHIAFRGKRNDGDISIIHELQTDGVKFGQDFNGFTTKDNTYYYVNLTNPDTKNLSTALAGFKELVDVSALTPETLSLEKKIIIAEKRRRNSAQERARQSNTAFVNPQNPRDKISGIGTEAGINAISLEQVRNFHTKHYTPDSALLVIAGDVDLKKTLKILKSNFSNWGKTDMKTHALDTSYDTAPEFVGFTDPDVKTEFHAITHRPSTLTHDSYAQRRNNFMTRRIMNILKRRLKARLEDTPKVSWMTPYYTQSRSHDLLGIKIGARDYEIAYNIFEEERRRLVSYGLTDGEFIFAFKNSRGGYERAANEVENIKAWTEAANIRRHFTQGEVYLSPQQDLENFEKFEASISKTDLNEHAKDIWRDFKPKYWTQSSRQMEKTVDRIRIAANEMKNETITPPIETPEPVFQKAAFAKIGKIKSRDFLKSENTHRLLFENGARLNFETDDTDKNEILIAISLKPQDDIFLRYYAAIAEKVPAFTWADIKGQNEETMRTLFAGQRVHFNTGLYEDRLYFSIATTPDDLRDSLDIISTFLTNFDFESKDRKTTYKIQLDRKKANLKTSPTYKGTVQLPSVYSNYAPVYKSDLRNLPVIEKFRDKEIKKIFEEASIEVGVIGDFENEALIKAFTETIGAMPPRPTIPKNHTYTDPNIVHKSPTVETMTYRGDAEQMSLFYCWPSKVDPQPDVVAKKFLSTNIVQNRFHAHIREDLGLSYTTQITGFGNPVFPEFGYICFSAQIDPKNEEVTLKGFEAVVAGLQSKPVSKSEFNRALKPLLSLQERYKTNKAVKAISLSQAYSNEARLQKIVRQKTAYENVSLTQARAYTKDAFNPSQRSIFRIQNFQSSAAVKRNTLLAKTYLGDTQAQYELGQTYLWGSNKEAQEKGLHLLKKAAEGGETKANLVIGNYYGKQEKLKLAARYFEDADNTADGAYHLSVIYHNNYKLFPDISDDRIIELAKYSAENGHARGQFFYAERLMDGTLTEQDEMGAMKWALIGAHNQSGDIKLTKDKHIKRFQTGFTKAEIAQATQAAKTWIEETEK